MESFITKKQQCKNCFKMVDAHVSTSDPSMPSKGDLSICGYCAMICKFDEELNLIPLNEVDLLILKNNHPDAWRILQMAKSHINADVKRN